MRIMIASRGIDNIAGGVERMSAALMNEMVRRGHAVSLLTWDKPAATSFFPLDASIAWHKIGLGDFSRKATMKTRLDRALAVRRAVKAFRPDIIVGFQDGMFMAARLYTLGMGIPVVAAERNAPSRFDFIQRGRYKQFVFQAMRFAKAVTIQCESYRDAYPAYLRDKIVTIPNPVEPAAKIANPEGRDNMKRVLLSIGRLGYQKNMETLIAAFALIAPRFPDWTLTIVGEGEMRANLERQARDAGLASRIALPGATQDVTPYLLNSQLFCLPSRWEGFPNVLAEAMAHGLPAIGFAGCAGVSDLIEPNQTGLLAPGNGDAMALAEALALLMADPATRIRMGAAGRDAIKAYAPARVFDQWEEFLRDQSNRSLG